MVNILVMNVSFTQRGEWELEQTSWIQQAAFFILETFFYSKFFVIFSLLFGMGVALQIQRAKVKGTFRNSFFIRRFTSLFLFGVMHILFIWSGDILHLYGALGFLLLFLFRFSAKVLLWTAIIVFVFPFYSEIFDWILQFLQFDHYSPLGRLSGDTIKELKLNGSYISGIQLRLKEYAYAMSLMYTGIGPIALSMMLLGGLLVKRGVLDHLSSWMHKTRIPLLITLIILTAYRFFLLYYIVPNFEVEHGSMLSFLFISLLYLADISLSLSYLWIIAYLLRTKSFHRVLSPLQYVGRTAFTNYILQSIIGYLIMRTFGYYQSFSAIECILIVLIVFTFQILISKVWLRYYRFGPLEWVWRCISYWKVLPIRK